ncbi:flavin monoamine oxidase family protein [Methylobacterium sp. J-068]|uniref:flavin monoamine oxidase family protein n=1 Tax=Methylobacterium sp. J-068 TaxID=2836649 RepID=UPI001FB8EBDB|nr:NAD(P)/FAD-dependent oxidoreductase [Methylobacterium sp. J-068]MCJ2034911.1 FAD-dependent oxidoreductase [Methylobacterium sp. J-068]
MRTSRPEHERWRPTIAPRLEPWPREPAVIVVGAGAAGIAAARTLRARGISVAVLEARDRVGGRLVTVPLRGHPVDLGGHWLHAGPINPLVRLGTARGEPLRVAAQASHLWVGRRRGRTAEAAALGRAFALADRAMSRQATWEGPDRPAASALPPGLGPWGRRVERVHGLVSGQALGQVSLQDFPSMEYGDNRFIAGGYGGYLARLAQGLPIALGMPVTGIDWSGPGVRVAAGDTTFAARAVIVTIPTMVMRETALFTPALPPDVAAAITGFRTGIYEHAVLHWPSCPFRGGDQLANLVGGREACPGLLTCIDGTPFHFFELDAPMAAALDARRAGADGVRRLVRATLAAHFGGRALHDLTIPAVSEWRHDPWARGSWAVVPPGHAGARAALRAPVADRVWFAGEALSRLQWGTAGGAYEEGLRAADAVADRLRA